VHPLIEAWCQFDSSRAPYVLEGDEVVVDDRWACRHSSWEAYSQDPNFGEPDDGRFHLDLLPVPFAGDLARASVYVLLLNPGLGPHDYFGEYKVPEFRDARLANLKQVPRHQFMDLNPAFSWHGGFRYWHSRLSALISAFAMRHNLSYGQSRQIFASEIASVELVPYHSKTFAFPAKLLTKLRSVQLVQSFVTDVLSPRARRGDCLIVVTRSSRYWGLKAARNIVLYEGSETRSAHLSPSSRGGDAILRFLQPGYRSRAA
jgi:hypothetical protein